ncbi:hypothetical protein Clacol_001401 [Clathrus columnatus]|uniref:Uncharacterized protein n=1 Tax=Clathrus columnatus TaxID=1419009 RepID=A0AAV4ZY64_9AGAM|nr:hypothetical protein Clacol_001401 [Clathrus columnatus]
MNLPPHTTSETNNTRKIDIFSWSLETNVAPIISASEVDAMQANLGFPLPEMTFGNNSLVIKHNPSGWEYRFDTETALKWVKNGELQSGDGSVKVGYSDAWFKSRVESDPSMSLSATKPYDWTYTSMYPGHLLEPNRFSFSEPNPTNPAHNIPIAELSRQDPILFYAEVPLYEDELHDNGMSQITIRVMHEESDANVILPTSTTYDTRMYHSFSSSPPLVVRESTGWEAPYEYIKRQLPSKTDLSPLIDPNYVAKSLTNLPEELSQGSGAGTGWRGLGSRIDISIIDQ